MNYNILSYFIYGCITVFIIIYVGKMFHQNGRIFILQLFQGKESLTDTTNNILLLAYYLFNIGYSVIQFSFWESIRNLVEMISSVSLKTGILVFILALTHYVNIFIIYILSNRNRHSLTIKKIQS